MGCTLVYCCMFAIGELVLQEWLPGLVLLLCAAASGYFIYWSLSRRGWKSFSVAPEPVIAPPRTIVPGAEQGT
jgi:hypothetical protein